MSELRIWFAARDPYHCAFRMIRILNHKRGPIPLDRLRLLDMFLMYPSLAHRLKLTQEVREKMRAVRIPAPKESFVHLPGTASIWQDLQLYQSAAVKQLAGRGLLDRNSLHNSYASLDFDQVPQSILIRAAAENNSQLQLMSFLVDDLGSLPLDGTDNIFKRAGLPARGPIA
jgi:hypothetical protein